MFDPNDDCVFVKEQKSKKKASTLKTPSRMKPTIVTLMIIQDVEKGVPRGAYKDFLIKNDKTVSVRLHREMSSTEVRSRLKKTLQPHVEDYTILGCCGTKLIICSEQQPSGATLIQSALKRRGSTVYVTKKIIEISDSSEVSLSLPCVH